MTSFSSRNSFGLAALAATSTLGVWILYSQFKHNPTTTKKNRKDSSTDTTRNDGPFDFITTTTTAATTTATTKPNLKRTVSECTDGTLNSKDIEQVYNSRGDIDLKIFRQLLEQKKRSKNHCSTKVDLFSHLLTKLEQTLDERDRIEYKLDTMRTEQQQQQQQQQQQNHRPSISKHPNPPNSKLGPPVVVPLNDTSVCLVVQRYRGATIMCNDSDCIRVGSKSLPASPANGDQQQQSSSSSFCGLMIYVSFAKGCSQSAVKTAAKIVVNLPVLTLGGWGDGAKTMNVIDLAKHHPNAASIVIVPQANLINRVKSQGRSIQYHGQIGKDEGNTLYHYFVNSVRGYVLESQCKIRNEQLPDWYKKSCSAQSGSSPSLQKASPSIPPEDLFRCANGDTSTCCLYSSFDETTGIPITDAEGEPITKSAQKKLRKLQAAHRVRHLKWLRENKNRDKAAAADDDDVSVSAMSQVTMDSRLSQQPDFDHLKHWANAIDPSFVQVVAGTFGKRQSLEFVADMGPFCHVVQV